MNNIKQHIAFRIATFVLMLAFLLPSAVKFAHIFEYHEHEICHNEFEAHLHTLDVDCDFYKFKLNTNYHFVFEYFELPFEETFFKINSTSYNFLNNHLQLSFSLRGPPVLV